MDLHREGGPGQPKLCSETLVLKKKKAIVMCTSCIVLYPDCKKKKNPKKRQAMPTFLPHKNYEIINVGCYKLVNL